MDEVIGLVMAVFIGSASMLAIWTSHKRKVLELQLKAQQEGERGTRTSVDALRQEIQNLRETTLQYDLSFDTALQRVERRMEGMEQRLNEVESQTPQRVGR